MQVASPCCSEEQISYSTGMSAPSFQFQWHLAGFNMLMLRPSSLRGSKPFTCSLVLPCSCLDSLGSLFLVREFPGHLVLDAHVCSKVPFLVRQAFRSYLKLLCVSGWCGQAPGLLLCHGRLKWVWTRPSPGPAWALWSVPLLKGTSPESKHCWAGGTVPVPVPCCFSGEHPCHPSLSCCVSVSWEIWGQEENLKEEVEHTGEWWPKAVVRTGLGKESARPSSWCALHILHWVTPRPPGSTSVSWSGFPAPESQRCHLFPIYYRSYLGGHVRQTVLPSGLRCLWWGSIQV